MCMLNTASLQIATHERIHDLHQRMFTRMFTWNALSPPMSMMGCLPSSSRELMTRKRVWLYGKEVRSSELSS